MQPARNERPLALVTGASSGIGAAFARLLARRGYDLVLVARRRERLEAVARELAALGAGAEVLVADLGRPEDLGRVEGRVAGEPLLSLLVNNAGALTRGPFHARDAAGEEELVRVHALAPLRLTHAALRAMLPRGRGAVIQVSSRAAFAPNPGAPTYAAAKAFLHRHALGLAPALAGTGVSILSVCPGNTRTELFARAGFGAEELARLPMIEPEEVAAAALEALARGELVCVPGERRAQRLLRRLAPHGLLLRAAGVLQRLAGV